MELKEALRDDRHCLGDTVIIIDDDGHDDGIAREGMSGIIVDIYEEYHDPWHDIEPFISYTVEIDETGERLDYAGAELD